ncbi:MULTISPECIES: cell division ATP-binding protein FtsE [Dethiosulfovibrio]|jgi:cell division transport system ATP-binding protein|uniref:ATP-binding cassette domain-containing protein n=2 Tax=Dethiosulfovibrio TaxID=47054 RepID=A0ABS9EKF8_9BACT|nr:MULTISPECIES: ATP-binding cassette domain-containing protein [Dethiosulfovibrio]MCF4113898.1 ATP-binding cassette domain-containing protein [Dethiosulfovibrio russensis]MCF4141689.1 ATP-binding cassette domain-containing protein [Dethiosulfovibrio marinus]MCF4143894.1 ATP-binding cassette domain-containing protein [Dethiosulfovibrio acidaminovorans]
MDVRMAGVTKVFKPDIMAISDLYLSIPKGDFVYLIGETGSGKSTLLRMITREVRPSRGQISVGGVNVRRLRRGRLPRYRRDIGVVFQDFKLLPHLTARENVAFTLEAMGLPPRVVKNRADEAVDRVGMWHRRNLRPPQLSGGEQQRVAIARAIVGSPALFLADEPTGNLDAHTAEYVMKLLLSIHAAGTTVIVATHDGSLVDSYRQRVVELHEGRLVRDERGGKYRNDGDL